MNLSPLNVPIKIGICTVYTFIYIPVLEALKVLHPYIIVTPQEADIIIVDHASQVNINNFKHNVLILGVSAEAYGLSKYTCDFEVGSHISPNNTDANKAWLPYIPIINNPFISTPLQKVARNNAWRRKDICWMASNHVMWRTTFVQLLEVELLKHGIHIDYLGKVGNTNSATEGSWRIAPRIYSQYKCVIVLENTIQSGYITEKLPNALLGRCIPITMYPEDHSVFPFPDTSDWQLHTTSISGLTGFAQEIQDVLSDEDAYLDKWDANPLLHIEFYDNYQQIYRGLQRLAVAIIDRWSEVKK